MLIGSEHPIRRSDSAEKAFLHPLGCTSRHPTRAPDRSPGHIADKISTRRGLGAIRLCESNA